MSPTGRLVGLNSPIVYLLVHLDPKHQPHAFAIHEDIICTHSRAFREICQPNRKALDDDCPICRLPFDPGSDCLLWCKAGCGKSFHKHCVKEWLKTSSACAYCRAVWEDDSTAFLSIDRVFRIEALRDEAYLSLGEVMGVYLRYLYGDPQQDNPRLGKCNAPAADELTQDLGHPTKDDETAIFLFKCFLLGDILRDVDFKRQVVEWIFEFFYRNETFSIGDHVVSETYGFALRCPPGSSFREFVSDMIVTFGNQDVTMEAFLGYRPVGLTKELALAKAMALKHCWRSSKPFFLAYFLDKYGTDEEAISFKLVHWMLKSPHVEPPSTVISLAKELQLRAITEAEQARDRVIQLEEQQRAMSGGLSHVERQEGGTLFEEKLWDAGAPFEDFIRQAWSVIDY